MADYYLLFSCELDELDSEQVAWCQGRLAELREAHESLELTHDEARGADFAWAIEDVGDGLKKLTMHSDGFGSVDHVTNFVQEFLRKFRPMDCWLMSLACTCDQPLVDAFGGGSAFVTAETINFVDAQSWAHERAQAFEEAQRERVGRA